MQLPFAIYTYINLHTAGILVWIFLSYHNIIWLCTRNKEETRILEDFFPFGYIYPYYIANQQPKKRKSYTKTCTSKSVFYLESNSVVFAVPKTIQGKRTRSKWSPWCLIILFYVSLQHANCIITAKITFYSQLCFRLCPYVWWCDHYDHPFSGSFIEHYFSGCLSPLRCYKESVTVKRTHIIWHFFWFRSSSSSTCVCAYHA